jgi:dTDP-4-dehydrorhamnose 3,5-epimerase
VDESKILITGGNGQLGRALREIYPKANFTDSNDLDITNHEALTGYDWSGVNIIINAAGYTNVDGAETPEGQELARRVNDEAVGYLAEIAADSDLILVHISTAYVFDGKKDSYSEDDPINPLGEYAKSKAAGEVKAAEAPKHYVIRTDSVIGDGKNFVRTMLGLAEKGISPTVVADQIIRPTFTPELARAIKFLLDKPAEYGIYNLTNEGDPVSWADFTREVFKQADFELKVTDTTLSEYFSSKPGVAPRPLRSVLDLSKIESIGFHPRDWRDDLKSYLSEEVKK